MSKFNLRDYVPSLQEWIRYGCDITWDDCSILKCHDDYVQLMFSPLGGKGTRYL